MRKEGGRETKRFMHLTHFAFRTLAALSKVCMYALDDRTESSYNRMYIFLNPKDSAIPSLHPPTFRPTYI